MRIRDLLKRSTRTAEGLGRPLRSPKTGGVLFGGFSGFDLNPELTLPFRDFIGGLIVNCGAIETVVVIATARLMRDPVVLDLAIDLPFSRRLDLLYELVKREGGPTKKVKRWKHALERTRAVFKVRNQVAHGPVIIARSAGSDAASPPDIVGAPNMKSLRKNKTRVVPVMGLAGLRTAVDEAAAIAEELNGLLQELGQPN